MAYIPRAPEPAICHNCGKDYLSNHLRRRYCSSSCNVLATQRRKKPGGAVSKPVVARESFAVPERFKAILGEAWPSGRMPFYITVEDGRVLMIAEYYSRNSKAQWIGVNGQKGVSGNTIFYVANDGTIWARHGSWHHRLDAFDKQQYQDHKMGLLTRGYVQLQEIDTEQMERDVKSTEDLRQRKLLDAVLGF